MPVEARKRDLVGINDEPTGILHRFREPLQGDESVNPRDRHTIRLAINRVRIRPRPEPVKPSHDRKLIQI